MARVVTKTRSSPSERRGARSGRTLGKLVGKRRCRNIGVRYSVYSVNVRFWRNLENSVVLYGQDVRNGRSCSLFANDVQIPKLAVVNSIGVFCFETESLTAQPDIAFPNRLRSASAGRKWQSPLAVVRWQ